MWKFFVKSIAPQANYYSVSASSLGPEARTFSLGRPC